MSVRMRADVGTLAGGIQESVDPSRLKPYELQEGFNCENRKLVLEKRKGFSKIQDVVGSAVSVRYLKQFISRDGTRYLLAGASGNIYKIT